MTIGEAEKILKVFPKGMGNTVGPKSDEIKKWEEALAVQVGSKYIGSTDDGIPIFRRLPTVDTGRFEVFFAE